MAAPITKKPNMMEVTNLTTMESRSEIGNIAIPEKTIIIPNITNNIFEISEYRIRSLKMSIPEIKISIG